MSKLWALNGGYGYGHLTHAYAYKYVGPKPWPSAKKWKMVHWNATTHKRTTLYFKALHEAIAEAARRIY